MRENFLLGNLTPLSFTSVGCSEFLFFYGGVGVVYVCRRHKGCGETCLELKSDGLDLV
jgi:hypothetical protein